MYVLVFLILGGSVKWIQSGITFMMEWPTVW